MNGPTQTCPLMNNFLNYGTSKPLCSTNIFCNKCFFVFFSPPLCKHRTCFFVCLFLFFVTHTQAFRQKTKKINGRELTPGIKKIPLALKGCIRNCNGKWTPASVSHCSKAQAQLAALELRMFLAAVDCSGSSPPLTHNTSLPSVKKGLSQHGRGGGTKPHALHVKIKTCK